MKRFIFEINYNKLINDYCFSYIGRSRINGNSLYFISFYTEQEIRIIDLQRKIARLKYNDKKTYKVIPKKIDNIRDYLYKEYKIILSINDVSKVGHITDHLPLL